MAAGYDQTQRPHAPTAHAGFVHVAQGTISANKISRTPQVTEQIEQLAKQIARQRDLIAELRKRLDAVVILGPEPSSERPETDADNTQLCALAARLADMTAELAHNSFLIETLLHKIEL